MKININGTYYEDNFYWKYYSCLYDLPEINWKSDSFTLKTIARGNIKTIKFSDAIQNVMKQCQFLNCIKSLWM